MSLFHFPYINLRTSAWYHLIFCVSVKSKGVEFLVFTNSELENHPLSVSSYYLFSIFPGTTNISRPSLSFATADAPCRL